jgi:polyhydroxyalkanoate synthase
MDASCQLHFAAMDALRRAQGDALGALGLSPAECDYRVLASGPHWRLRAYSAASGEPPVLIVAAPIKRPYIWDLAPTRSAIRYCLSQHLSVYLLEWLSPASGRGSAGLDAYAGEAISECLPKAIRDAGGEEPFLMGHSLGGALAAIHAALNPQGVRGLVLLGAPLCFQPGVSRFRDALVSLVPSGFLSDTDVVPGSLLSQASALASPSTFIWSRLTDAVLSLTDPAATAIHARVERWALDEVPLPGRLVHEIVEWLYREDRFYQGTLPICGKEVGPSALRLPTLMVINTADEIAPPASVAPFAQAMPKGAARIIEYAGESGVGLQHLAILVGRQAYARLWPEIMSWLEAPSAA